MRVVAGDTTRDMSESGADALLPVLAARDESVREKVDAHFPGSRTVWWDDTLCVNSWGLCRLVVTVGAAHAAGPPLA